MARISLVDPISAPPAAREIYDRIQANGARVVNMYRVLGHSPAVMQNVLRLGNSLLGKTTLPARLRELAILRVAAIHGCDYEWNHHYVLAVECGLTPEQIQAVRAGENPRYLGDQEITVLRFVDELSRNVRVSDETFTRLKQHFDERTTLELTVAIGFYGMLARLLVGLEVDIDPGAGSVRELRGNRNEA